MLVAVALSVDAVVCQMHKLVAKTRCVGRVGLCCQATEAFLMQVNPVLLRGMTIGQSQKGETIRAPMSTGVVYTN